MTNIAMEAMALIEIDDFPIIIYKPPFMGQGFSMAMLVITRWSWCPSSHQKVHSLREIH